jgi:hypothetical protein
MSKIIRAYIALNDANAPSPTSGNLVIESIGTETLTVTGLEAYGFTFSQTTATIPAGQGTSINFSTNSYVGGTRVVTIASDKTSGDAQPQCTIARTTDNAIVIPAEDAAAEPSIHDFKNEVDALMRPGYPPNRVIEILARKAEGSGGDAAFTAYISALDTAEEDAAENLGYYPISVSVAEGTVIAAGATKAITVTAAGDYTVTCPAGCTSDITDGTPSDTTVTITVAANTDVARAFAITFTSGNMTPVVGTINQAAAAAAVVVTPATDSAIAAGEVLNVVVSDIRPTSLTCTASVGEASWITLSKTTGITAETITATSAANTGIEREGTVTVTRGTATDTCVITQAAAADAVTVTPATDTALAAGEVIDVVVSAISPVGTTCTASADLEGTTLSKDTGISNETITATIPENLGAERVITVTVTRGTATDTCVITQAAGA